MSMLFLFASSCGGSSGGGGGVSSLVLMLIKFVVSHPFCLFFLVRLLFVGSMYVYCRVWP